MTVSKKPLKDARSAALMILQGVIVEGESLNTLLTPMLETLPAQEKSFAQMLVYGVLRHRWQLEAIISLLLSKPLKTKDSDIQLIVMLALFQLLDTRVPEYAAVDAAVKLVKKTGKSWARALVNGVLRNFTRQKDELLNKIETDQQAVYSHPQWMIEKIKTDWPDHWQQILRANNQQAPMVLRVNARYLSAAEYAAKLDTGAQPHASAEQALVLEQACDVHQLPGYNEGWFSVQDAGAQLAAVLLDAQPGDRVLDCCAAPGGKTGHILERQPDLLMLAMDISASRLKRVEDNLQRLGLSANLHIGSAEAPDDWWDKQMFDRILLDVPCSASGVIRRHPDIKSLRREADMVSLVETQRKILNSIWPLLKPGGRLLYATCSIFKQENEQQMEAFLAMTQDASEILINATWGQARSHGRQIFPGEQDMDGFYYAILQKKA
ncbi:MAG: 16S rRNA (cytosine(967)-C(5))-methyltransferase RsmB [Gammaproteobacteria bacterium]|nr:16S rRNA (cytosine(967)-C(5))-methyltransferase RsmB [Gammaproteobacteria bacterium]MDH5735362.1 16S rRNA (cytosine(967)-C(5))-methyltransferase RsmB [Gammaproteobacteria bacterium]